MIRIVREGSPEFERERERLRRRGTSDLESVEPAVRAILADVRKNGDAAVLAFSEQFDQRRPSPLFFRDYDGEAALGRLDASLRDALRLAAERVTRYHERQQSESFFYEEQGIKLGLRVRPIDRAGVYAPGGKARYPSSVLMSAIPARVAGVRDIVLATPAPDDVILAAAHLSGVTGVLDAGGAQAIAALAYGTESVPRADKIVGPGNRYVACAKRLVFGEVGIDSIAGPSEILVLCDDSADPALVAADLLAQAEHDEAAYPLCIASDETLAGRVAAEVSRQLSSLPRRGIAEPAVTDNGCIFVVTTRRYVAELAHEIAAEHVAIHMREPRRLFDEVGAIGAAFVGDATPEAAGDYLSGPSHVLPTGGVARYGSPLGVYDFLARSSYIEYTRESLAAQIEPIATLARAEGLEAHARAAEARRGPRQSTLR